MAFSCASNIETGEEDALVGLSESPDDPRVSVTSPYNLMIMPTSCNDWPGVPRCECKEFEFLSQVASFIHTMKFISVHAFEDKKCGSLSICVKTTKTCKRHRTLGEESDGQCQVWPFRTGMNFLDVTLLMHVEVFVFATLLAVVSLEVSCLQSLFVSRDF